MSNYISAFAGTAIPSQHQTPNEYYGSTANMLPIDWPAYVYWLTLKETLIGSIVGHEIQIWANSTLIEDFRVRESFDFLIQILENMGWIPSEGSEEKFVPPDGLSSTEMHELLEMTRELYTRSKGKKDE